ncbi:ScbA/BarX family gamma-butyrolactone biosynthesis protein [Streptomyces genisteinicus]|uniref:Gamma-butyrolactone biosynthesis protein n=1 Tax=Streptomyces genisteinicus TaxID=2768068 RepID=A0A7H0HZL8_9ACTN|nr:ScbA/BarX family gamma-butyrolactone biosynthesis protein [Streptomyces genisteinicus]QNP65984.1 gamma-butyrolactone biosynthesis protein [Streptomyces genisteinicus]
MSVVLDDPRTTQAPSPGAGNEVLSFLQPVTRELVHRTAVAEVFVTDGVRTGANTFSVAAQWPRDHALYHPDENGLNDPLLCAETLRQAYFFGAHTYFGVPLGSRFIGQDVSFEITDPAALRVGAVPAAVVLHGTWTEEHDRRGRRAGARLDVTFTVDGRPCGRGHTRGLMVDDRRYGLLRGRPATAEGAVSPRSVPDARTVGPGRVGRLRWKDCVLQRDRFGRRWGLRVDRDHAVLFDHPTDHVPLMVMLEGFRQFGHLTVHEAPRNADAGRAFALAALSLDCAAFGELGEEIVLELDELSPDGCTLLVAARQGEKLLARAGMTWTCVGSRAPRLGLASW